MPEQPGQPNLPIADPTRAAIVALYHSADEKLQRLLGSLDEARTNVALLETAIDQVQRSRNAARELICFHYPDHPVAKAEQAQITVEAEKREAEKRELDNAFRAGRAREAKP